VAKTADGGERRVALCVLALVVGMPAPARCETRQRLNESGDYPIDLDSDSVSQSGNGSFVATRRLRGTPTETDPLVMTYTGTLASREGCHLKTLALAHPGRQSIAEPPIVIDFKRRESINGQNHRPLSNFDLTQEYGFPVGADGLGIVRKKCALVCPGYEKARDAQIATDRANLRCDSKAPLVPLQLCATSNGYLAPQSGCFQQTSHWEEA
jgi:hypothetical protein